MKKKVETISERRNFHAEVYDDAQMLLKIWIAEMKEIIKDPERRTSADFSNILKFLKDNNVILELPMPVADTCMDLVQDEELPSFMSKDDFMKEQ